MIGSPKQILIIFNKNNASVEEVYKVVAYRPIECIH
jgi:hypothetical protein